MKILCQLVPFVPHKSANSNKLLDLHYEFDTQYGYQYGWHQFI